MVGPLDRIQGTVCVVVKTVLLKCPHLVFPSLNIDSKSKCSDEAVARMQHTTFL